MHFIPNSDQPIFVWIDTCIDNNLLYVYHVIFYNRGTFILMMAVYKLVYVLACWIEKSRLWFCRWTYFQLQLTIGRWIEVTTHYETSDFSKYVTYLYNSNVSVTWSIRKTKQNCLLTNCVEHWTHHFLCAKCFSF